MDVSRVVMTINGAILEVLKGSSSLLNTYGPVLRNSFQNYRRGEWGSQNTTEREDNTVATFTVRYKELTPFTLLKVHLMMGGVKETEGFGH